MAKRKKKQSKKANIGIDFNDERFTKIYSGFLILLAVYLAVAFVSYLSTWQIDQDKVLRTSWSTVMSGDLKMANWMGRFGAIISNFFFYWGIGLSSFAFPFLLAYSGVSKIQGEKSSGFLWGIVSIGALLIAIFLEFLFPQAAFPWGGAIGSSLSIWLVNFLGFAGVGVLFLFIVFASITWFINPDFRAWTFNYLGIPTFLQKNGKGRTQKTRAKTDNDKDFTLIDYSEDGIQKTKERSSPFEFNITKPKISRSIPPLLPKRSTKSGSTVSNASEPSLGTELEIAETPLEDPNLVANRGHETPKPVGQPHPLDEVPEPEIDQTPYDPKLELSEFNKPSIELLNDYSDQKIVIDKEELESNKDQIVETLLNYKIQITKIKATVGPTVTLYEIVPEKGVRISSIRKLEDDIALSLAALGIRIIAPIPGKGTIGIEVPNRKKQIVSLKEVIRSQKFQEANMELPLALGKTISNEVFVTDLTRMPHLLIAGATGQGKSVGINAIITSLLYKKHPAEVKLVLIDPKKVELFPYSKIAKHYLSYLPDLDEPIVTDTTKVVHTLNSLIIEMETRYDLLKGAHVRNIKEYNTKFKGRRLNPLQGHKFLPYIVLIIDEFADLIMTAGKEVELPIGRLAQLSRAVGIHLIIATQRPSVNIITGVIKANFPARIAFKVTQKVDSRTIIDTGGADRLIGRGDMLISFGGDLTRLQCAFIDTPEVDRVLNDIASQPGYPAPYFLPEFTGEESKKGSKEMSPEDYDSMFHEAAELVVANQHGSTSMIQRRLKLGFNRAGRIMDQLEHAGIVGPSEGSKAREVYVFNLEELEQYLNNKLTRK